MVKNKLHIFQASVVRKSISW